MPLPGLRQIGKSIEQDGKSHRSYVHKTAIQSPGVAGKWIDTSQSSGIPKYNPYPGQGLELTALVGIGNTGINSGTNIVGSSKHLARWQATYTGVAPTPCYKMLCDYIGFYTLIDCDDDTEQTLTNPISLPRYADGLGVQMCLVGAVAGTQNATIVVTYTNIQGVSGRVSTSTYINPPSVGVVCSSSDATPGVTVSASPFLPLANGDRGVRSVQSVQFLSAAGGFCTLVLMKPLANLAILETGVAAEKSFGTEFIQMPEILSGAYLNMISLQGAAQPGNLRCEFLFINS